MFYLFMILQQLANNYNGLFIKELYFNIELFSIHENFFPVISYLTTDINRHSIFGSLS